MIAGPQFYKLIGKCPVPCSFEEWTKWSAKRGGGPVIIKQEHIGPLYVSTVFLGLDHNLFIGPPHLFETMIFDDFHDAYQCRCTTWDQAEFMHEAAVAVAEQRVKAAEEGLKSHGTSSGDNDDPAQGTMEGEQKDPHS